MKKLILILFITVAALVSPAVFAVEGRNGENNENDNRIRTEIEQRIERDDDRVRIRIRQEREIENDVNITAGIQQKVEIEGNRFEIIGEVTKVDSDNFTVASQIVFIDVNLVKEFEQKGTLKVGERVEVEGIIIDGRKFAREINVFTNNSQIQIEVKNATQAARARVEIKSRGALDQITELLREILNFLTGQKIS